eukprot:2132613-Karenia_brevis.AAC.1
MATTTADVCNGGVATHCWPAIGPLADQLDCVPSMSPVLLDGFLSMSIVSLYVVLRHPHLWRWLTASSSWWWLPFWILSR